MEFIISEKKRKKKSASIAVKRAKERRDEGGKYIGRVPILKMCKVFVEVHESA